MGFRGQQPVLKRGSSIFIDIHTDMNNKLTIQQVALYKLSIPLIEPFITSLGRDENAENVLVKIMTAEGLIGFGECSPYMPINGESQDTCFIVGQYFAKALKGKDPLQIEECIAIMDKVIYGNTSIKSAFDMAFYDIASQQAGMPLYQFIAFGDWTATGLLSASQSSTDLSL